MHTRIHCRTDVNYYRQFRETNQPLVSLAARSLFHELNPNLPLVFPIKVSRFFNSDHSSFDVSPETKWKGRSVEDGLEIELILFSRSSFEFQTRLEMALLDCIVFINLFGM